MASVDCRQVTPSSAHLRTEPNGEEWWLKRLFDHPGDRLCPPCCYDAIFIRPFLDSSTCLKLSSTEDYLGTLSSLCYYLNSKLQLPSYQIQCSFPNSIIRIFSHFHIRVSVPPTYPGVFPNSSPNQISAFFKCSFITALGALAISLRSLDFKTIQNSGIPSAAAQSLFFVASFSSCIIIDLFAIHEKHIWCVYAPLSDPPLDMLPLTQFFFDPDNCLHFSPCTLLIRCTHFDPKSASSLLATVSQNCMINRREMSL